MHACLYESVYNIFVFIYYIRTIYFSWLILLAMIYEVVMVLEQVMTSETTTIAILIRMKKRSKAILSAARFFF